LNSVAKGKRFTKCLPGCSNGANYPQNHCYRADSADTFFGVGGKFSVSVNPVVKQKKEEQSLKF